MQLSHCAGCGLLWQKQAVLPQEHYRTLVPDVSPAKLAVRLSNCRGRARIMRKSIPPCSVCDVGCGEGLMLQALTENGYAPSVGIEPNPENVRVAREAGWDVLQGGVEDFASLMAGKDVRAATLFHVIEHLEDPFASLRVLWESLPPGSFLVLETPNLNSYSSRVLGDDWGLIYPEHLWYFSSATLRRAVEGAGFRVLAEGKRDFNGHLLPFGEILFRLGLRKKHQKPKTPSSAAGSSPAVQREGMESRKGVSHIPKLMVRTLLSRVVALLGRTDYIWMIAEKRAVMEDPHGIRTIVSL